MAFKPKEQQTTPKLPKAAAGKADAPDKDEKKPKVSFLFAREIYLSDLWRVDAEGQQLFRWDEIHWKPFSRKHFKNYIVKWLEANYHGFEYGKNARDNCFEMATDKLCSVSGERVLPDVPRDRSILAFQDCWLEILRDGTIARIAPDKSIGVHSTIKVSIGATTDKYTPARLPADSRFSKFLLRMVPDEDVRACLQEFCGYTLLTNSRELAQFWLGTGSNGKSTMEKLLSSLHEGARFEIPTDASASGNLSGLIGATLAVASDVSISSRIDSSFFKKLSSAQTIKVRNLYQDTFDYIPVAKPLYLCNDMPKFTESLDHAHRRRISIIPFNVQISDEEKDIMLGDDILKYESRLFLDWCLEGAVRVCSQDGFTTNATLKASKEAALSMACPFTKWVSERKPKAVFNPGQDRKLMVIKDDVYRDFKNWVDDAGITLDRGTRIPDRLDFFKRLNDAMPEIKKWGVACEAKLTADVKNRETGRTERKQVLMLSLAFEADLPDQDASRQAVTSPQVAALVASIQKSPITIPAEEDIDLPY